MQGSTWSLPQTIPGYDLDAIPPVLIADQNRTVHAFSTQWVQREANDQSVRAIVYNTWTLENGWANPVDIIMSPIKEARLTDVYLDPNGKIHLTFWGGDGTGADLYYTDAPAKLAADSRSWTVPLIIGEKAGDPEGASFVEDDNGTIFVVYNGREQGNGIYVVNSKNGGETWSNPIPIYFAPSDKPNLSYLKAIKSKSGSLNVIWGVYSIDGQGRRIYHSRSEDGEEWVEPVLLAEAPGGLGTQTPTIIQYDDELFALFILPPKVMMRRSSDDGKTWSDPSILFPRHVGVNGSLSLVIDSGNNLHLFFGQRISGNPDIHGMWHSIWKNGRWSEPDAVVKGPRIVDDVGYNGFDPYAARAVISQGNTILVTWRTDYLSKGNGIWYSYRQTDTPELPVVDFSSAANPDTNTDSANNLQVQSTSTVQATDVPTLENSQAIRMPTDRPDLQRTFSSLILIGSVLVLLLSLIVIVTFGSKRRK